MEEQFHFLIYAANFCVRHIVCYFDSPINKGQFALFVRRRRNKGTKRKQWMRKRRGRLALILTQECGLNCDRTRKKRALTDNVPRHFEFRRVESSREKRWELVRAIRIKDFSLGNRISLGVQQSYLAWKSRAHRTSNDKLAEPKNRVQLSRRNSPDKSAGRRIW